MNKKIIGNDYSINSILGENALLKGHFSVHGPLRIDGKFIGKIDSSGKVIIGKNGRAECLILAKTVVIGGTVKGDIYAEERVEVLKTGEVIGNIYSCSITMQDGVIFNGKCKIIDKDDINDIIEKRKKEKFNIN